MALPRMANLRQSVRKEKRRAAPPRFEHGLLAPQAGVISKLHYRALVFGPPTAWI